MFTRLLTAYLLLLAAALAIFGAFAARTMRERMLLEVSARLEAQTELLRPVVRATPRPDVQRQLRQLAESTGSRLTLIDADGTVVADSHMSPARLDNHNGRPEVRDARAQGRGRATRRSDSLNEDMMYAAAVVDAADGPVVRAALPLMHVSQGVTELYAALALAFLATALAGAGATWLLSRWFERPLTEIRVAAQKVASGDFSPRLRAATPAEMGGVSAAFNRMTHELSGRIATVRAETAKLDAVVSSMDEAVVAVDNEGRIARHNAAALRLFDIPVDPRGLKLWEVVRLPELQEKLQSVLRDGTRERALFEIGTRAVATSMTPISGGEGAVVVAHDTTEQRRYDTLRKEFVANVSHELRTPLTLIQGFVETLQDGALKDEARAREFLDTIDRNVRRLAAIVSDLLELSRLESPGQIARPRAFPLRALLARVREEFQPLADRKRQTLQVVDAPEEVEMEADPDLVERALDNLVGNAIKYTPDGGHITLRAEADDAEVTFTVDDTGVGIPPKDLPRVFERFYRVDKSRARDLGGTGLGLAIVKHIAQLHSGTVSVRSTVGAGSNFELKLPRSFQPPE